LGWTVDAIFGIQLHTNLEHAMPYQKALDRARLALAEARRDIIDEMRSYPTPVSGCDAQYNHLIAQRSAISDALDALAHPPFVATPRQLTAERRVESR
jgi:hypothetical protein